MSAPPPIVNTLALAIIAGSTAPLILLDGELTIVAASASFYAVFDIEPGTAIGRGFLALGDGEWMTPQLHNLLRATLSGGADIEAYEHLLRRPGEAERAVVLNIKRLEGEEGARLVVTLSDVTEARMAARLKDEMIREKGILLDEVQHRVANSLQIIASVLLQNARKVSSEESRAHLRDAHDRVMSMATVQRQLSAAKLGEVDLKPYFHELCDSLAASMISDHAQQSIVVTVDDSRVKANVSISLGLIVTELLINAIKHAFPVGAPGRIEVDYHSRGPNWALTVADNGQGFPTNPSEVKPGLGTSIIEALARQLEAKVSVRNTAPGTAVSVSHTQIAAVEDLAGAL